MKAVAVTPGKKHSARVIDVPAPRPGPHEVLVRVQRIGIDSTDVEIDRAEYGEAPAGSDFLVIGHECVGVVERVGEAVDELAVGDHVVPMVRRPDDCKACTAGEPDMCLRGDYTERGIKGAHGFLTERFVEQPRYLVRVPAELAELGVLLEPLSISEKGLRHAWAIQRRMRYWEPRRALVLGAGPIGVLAAMLLRLRALETYVFARTPSAETTAVLGQIGATYVAKHDEQGRAVRHLGELPDELGPFDVVIEATGSAQVAMGAMRILGVNGVLILTSVTGGETSLELCASCVNLDLVLGNRAVFGTVNAAREDFEHGVHDLVAAEERWPGWLHGLTTRAVPLAQFRDAFERRPDDLKVVIEP